jgi:hypothetical protein
VKVMELLERKLTGSSAFVTRELGAEVRLVWCCLAVFQLKVEL